MSKHNAATRPRGNQPLYELRATRLKGIGPRLEVWQNPSPVSPHIRKPRRVAGLHGRNLELVEHRVLRRLKADNIELAGSRLGVESRFTLPELPALQLGLLFRVLAPMRSRANMVACTAGIEEMDREEAAYWLGMAMHRKRPRRVLMALRNLLTDTN